MLKWVCVIVTGAFLAIAPPRFAAAMPVPNADVLKAASERISAVEPAQYYHYRRYYRPYYGPRYYRPYYYRPYYYGPRYYRPYYYRPYYYRHYRHYRHYW